jgi:hypothetical protein
MSRNITFVLGDQLYDGLQANESCDTTLHAQALPCSQISCLKEMEVAFQTALIYRHYQNFN